MNDSNWLSTLGPLAPLCADPQVLEILVDAPDRVLIEREGKLVEAGVTFASPEALRAVIDAVFALGGVTLGAEKTTGDIRLPDGSRALAVLSPTAGQGPYLVIRKLVTQTLTWDDLFKFGVISREAFELLQRAVRAPVNILVAGGAGSGKTTLTGLLAEVIPDDQRVIVVEGARELRIRHPRVISLEAGGPANLSVADVLSTAARMRPDWLIAGELLGAEAMRALEIMSRGHSGMTTLHATSPEDALARLETMCLMANLGLGLGEIRGLIAAALKLIVIIRKLPDGRRKVVQIVELRGLENDRYVLRPLARYDAAGDEFEMTGAKPAWE